MVVLGCSIPSIDLLIFFPINLSISLSFEARRLRRCLAYRIDLCSLDSRVKETKGVFGPRS